MLLASGIQPRELPSSPPRTTDSLLEDVPDPALSQAPRGLCRKSTERGVRTLVPVPVPAQALSDRTSSSPRICLTPENVVSSPRENTLARPGMCGPQAVFRSLKKYAESCSYSSPSKSGGLRMYS